MSISASFAFGFDGVEFMRRFDAILSISRSLRHRERSTEDVPGEDHLTCLTFSATCLTFRSKLETRAEKAIQHNIVDSAPSLT